MPPPLRATRRTNAISRSSGYGSATATITQAAPVTRRSSLRRAGAKTPSPDVNRVRFIGTERTLSEDGSQAQYPRTPGTQISVQTPKAPRKASTRGSPSMFFSPRTAQKAAEAARVVQEQTALIDERLESPAPMSSKTPDGDNFRGGGVRMGTGLPPTPTRQSTRIGLQTPPETVEAGKTRAQTARERGPATKEGETTIQQGGATTRNITITPSTTSSPRQIYIHGVSDWLAYPKPPAQRFSSDTPLIEIPTSALLAHMADLKANPRALALEELHIQFYLLQKTLRQFTKQHFRSAWSPSRTASFPLADLSALPETQPFFRIASYLADGSTFQSGWSSFLTSEHTRPHLAYAILAEWLRYNVFGHSCFGLSPEEDKLMTDIDVRYLHWDGFVRTKERAKLLRRILHNKQPWEVEMDMSSAVSGVVSDLLIVLGPILPDCQSQMAELKSQLAGVVDMAANLHQCIRLTGMDGTIIRFAPSSKGNPFAYTARQNCVNKATVTATVDEMIAAREAAGPDAKTAPVATGLAPRVRDRLVIKLPCFPHVFATVPYGPTLKDYAVEQTMYETVVRSGDLPPVKGTGLGPQYIEDIPAEIVRASCMEPLPESCHRDYGRRLDVGEKRKQAWGSYVKEYILNESDVYCEWEFEGEVIENKGITLRTAVEAAERAKYGFVRREKRERRARIAVSVAGTLAVGIAASTVAAVRYGLAKHTPLGAAAVSLVKNLNQRLPEGFALEDVKGAVKTAMKAADAKTKTFQRAAKLSFRITKHYARKYTSGSVAAAKAQLATAQAQAQAQRLAHGVDPADLANSAVSKASNVAETAASVVKDAVMGETPLTTTTPGLLSSILEPIHIGIHETPVKLGIELGRVADPTSRVSKVAKTVMSDPTVTAVAKWYDHVIRGVGRWG
jgi:hypothetical protein